MLSRFDLNRVKLQGEKHLILPYVHALRIFVYIKVGPSKNIVIKESFSHRRNQRSGWIADHPLQARLIEVLDGVLLSNVEEGAEVVFAVQ